MNKNDIEMTEPGEQKMRGSSDTSIELPGPPFQRDGLKIVDGPPKWYQRPLFKFGVPILAVCIVIAVVVGINVSSRGSDCGNACVLAPANSPTTIIDSFAASIGLRLRPRPGTAANGDVTDPKAILAQVPFAVVAVLPSDGTQLYSRQALTIAYSRPVLPLGSNFDSVGVNVGGVVPATITCNTPLPVPGKWRWVTTSILRFDPDSDWANNLKCVVAVSAEIKSIDGTPLSTAPAPQTYTSNDFQIYLNGVTSARADALTGGLWSPSVNGGSYEVPPDGVIQISVPIGFDLASLSKAFVVSPTAPTMNVSACGAGCVYVTFSGASPLTNFQSYTLTIPRGASIQPYGGPTTTDTAITFMGLKPFTFPFQAFNEWSLPTSRRLRLWVRHGIADTTTIAASLLPKLSLVPAVANMALAVIDVATLELRGDFQRSTSYTLSVPDAPTILDGFGLPLTTCSVTFTTGVERPFASFLENGVSLGGRTPPAKTFVHDVTQSEADEAVKNYRCDANIVEMKAVAVGEVETLVRFLARETGTSFDANRASFKDNVRVVTPTSDVYRTSDVPVASLLEKGGVAVIETSNSNPERCGNYKNYALLSNGSFGMTLLTRGSSALVWVTETMGRGVAANVKVEFWKVGTQGWKVGTLAGTATTNSQGFAIVSIKNQQGPVLVAATVGTQLVITQFFMFSSNSDFTPPENVVMHTERMVYQPGDVIFLKGYIRTYSKGTNDMVSPGKLATQVIVVNWGDDGTTQVTVPITNYDPVYGSFSVRISVPLNAKYRKTMLSLGDVSTSIVVADPRIPTNVFDFTSPNATLRPSGDRSIILRARTATYAGSAVPSSKIDIVWAIVGPNATSGTATITTDAQGMAQYTLAIPGAVAGNRLSVSATWLTPTREVLTGAVTMPVEDSLWTLTIDQFTSRMVASLPTAVSAVLTGGTGSGTVTFTADGTTATCQGLVARVGSVLRATCALTLPAMGRYSLVATTVDDAGFITKSVPVSVGLPRQEWEDSPVTASTLSVGISIPSAVADATTKKIRVAFTNPFRGGAVARAMWWHGNALNESLGSSGPQVLPELPEGDSYADITIAPECVTGCGLSLAVIVYGGSFAALSVPVPMSAVEDFSSPRVFSFSTNVRVEYCVTSRPFQTCASRDFPLAVTTPSVAAPSSSVRLTISASSLPSGIRSEVTVMIVDKAILSVMPNPLPSLASDLTSVDISGQQTPAVDTIRSQYLSASTLQRMNDNLKARLDGNPWSDTVLSKTSLHMTSSRYLENKNSPLTFFPYRPSWSNAPSGGMPGGEVERMMPVAGGAMPNAMPGPPGPPVPSAMTDRSVEKMSPSPPPPAVASGPAIRTVFSRSPVFLERLVMTTGTKLVVDITLPDNVGTWVVKIMAVTPDGDFATATSDIIARKPLGMVPSLPRQVRFGDRFTAGVVVTLFADSSAKVTLGVQVPRELSLTGPSSIDLTLTPNSPREVLFSFEAIGFCEGCAITFTASGATDATLSDGLRSPLPLLAAQQMVYIGTSFSLLGSKATNWTEGMELPAAVPGSGAVALMASVGRYQSVKAIGNGVISATSNVQESGSRLLELMAAFIATELGYSTTIASPAAFREAYNMASSKLGAYTHPQFGLMYSYPSQQIYYYVDINLNLNALYLHNLRPIQDTTLTVAWTTAVSSAMAASVERAFQYTYEWTDYDTLAMVFLVLGPGWTPAGASTRVKDVLSFNNMLANVKLMSVGGRATLLNVLLGVGDRPLVVTTIAQSLLNNIRITGRTAYVAVDKEEYHCSMRCQGMALMGLARVPEQAPEYLVSKIANLVAEGFPTSYWWWGTGGFDVVVRMISLAAYDKGRQSGTPDLRLSIKGLVDTTFVGAEGLSKQFGANYTFAQIGSSPLSFQALGTGEVSIALGLSFAPTISSTKPKYFGLFVEKVTRLVKTGQVLTSPYTLSVGDTVEVQISVTTPDDVSGLLLEDFLPGGLEAVDPNLSTPPTPITNTRYSSYRDSCIYDPWRWSFAYKEVKSDRVIFMASYLWAGTHTARYYASAVTSGTFVAPAAKGSLMRQPEVMGLSATEQMTVLPR